MEKRDLRALAPAIQPRASPYPRPPRRKRTSIACHPCRERRSACDGARPACSPCSARKLACSYANAEDSEMRPTVLRSQIATLGVKVAAHEEFIGYLRSLSQDTVRHVVQRLRAGVDVATLLDELRGAHQARLISTPQDTIATLAPDHDFRPAVPGFDLVGLGGGVDVQDPILACSLPFVPAVVGVQATQEGDAFWNSQGYHLSTTRQLGYRFLAEHVNAKRDSYAIMATGHGFPVER